MMEYIWLVPALPLLGVVINGLFGRIYLRERAHLVAVPAAGLSFLVALLISFQVMGGARWDQDLYTWIAAGDLQVGFGFLVDPLSAVMMLVVTFVGFLIHVYSIGYMHGDPGYPRFFAYLNLFMFSMLMLVLANNYLLMFLGWEGVGLCSYLLIGFWYEKKTATDAGNKAFIVNRVGDAGFLLGLFLLWTTFGSFRYAEVFTRAETTLAAGSLVATLITLGLFVGAMGKSAQLPLYVWLPDAMEGPTPVSALIHAATMVTAGVYMVARSSTLYNLAPFSQDVVATVGAVTAVFAAIIACLQTDIKKVIAYSTISQLGYMFLAVGVGAYTSGIFHLATHAFFKALLFLGAGAVIHAMHGEQDIRRMGGLFYYMRITALTFLVGALANAGVPPFAGFFSKDEILFAAFTSGHTVVWLLGLMGAFLTAFYMFRLYFVTFTGRFRGDSEVGRHLHDAPGTMRNPLVILALCAVIAGFVGVPPDRGIFHRFLAPVLHGGGEAHHGIALEAGLAALSVLIALGGIGLAFLLYVKWRDLPDLLAERFHALYTFVYNKYYVDELYNTIFVDGVRSLCGFLWRVDEKVVDGTVNGAASTTVGLGRWSDWGDIRIVDGLVNGIADVLQGGSGVFRRFQSGLIQNYILAMALGIFLIVSVYLFF